MFKLKERVKKGELSPDQALDLVKKQFYGEPPARLVRWLNSTGRERYAQARKG